MFQNIRVQRCVDAALRGGGYSSRASHFTDEIVHATAVRDIEKLHRLDLHSMALAKDIPNVYSTRSDPIRCDAMLCDDVCIR